MSDKILLRPVPKDEITVPVSKSELHRALFCAALAKGKTEISFSGGYPDDIGATLNVVSALGAEAVINGNGITVVGADKPRFASETVDVGESGTTLRMALPVAAVSENGENVRFIRRGSLAGRPVGDFPFGCEIHGESVTVTGKLDGKSVVDPSVTSQNISGILIALAASGKGGKLELSGRPVSSQYIGMTVSYLEKFGAEIVFSDGAYTVSPGKLVSPGKISVPGDWSAAAFAVCAGLIAGKEIKINGLDENSRQGDKIILETVRNFPSPMNFDASENPDLVPPLAALACFSDGKSVITGAGRLRFKESDRLSALSSALSSIGGDVTETSDGLVIKGKKRLSGGVSDSFGDHRIAMAAGIAAIGCDGGVTVKNSECVSKSWKDFWSIFNE